MFIEIENIIDQKNESILKFPEAVRRFGGINIGLSVLELRPDGRVEAILIPFTCSQGYI